MSAERELYARGPRVTLASHVVGYMSKVYSEEQLEELSGVTAPTLCCEERPWRSI